MFLNQRIFFYFASFEIRINCVFLLLGSCFYIQKKSDFRFRSLNFFRMKKMNMLNRFFCVTLWIAASSKDSLRLKAVICLIDVALFCASFFVSFIIVFVLLLFLLSLSEFQATSSKIFLWFVMKSKNIQGDSLSLCHTTSLTRGCKEGSWRDRDRETEQKTLVNSCHYHLCVEQHGWKKSWNLWNLKSDVNCFAFYH